MADSARPTKSRWLTDVEACYTSLDCLALGTAYRFFYAADSISETDFRVERSGKYTHDNEWPCVSSRPLSGSGCAWTALDLIQLRSHYDSLLESTGNKGLESFLDKQMFVGQHDMYPVLESVAG